MFPKNARVAQETIWTKCCPAHKCNSSSFVAIWFCVSPSELWCCHICTCSTWIWIVHRCCDLVYTFVLIDWHICSSLYKCKWLVGFYLLLPCTLNWNFALGEIYQFQPFQIEVALPFFLNNHLIKNYFLLKQIVRIQNIFCSVFRDYHSYVRDVPLAGGAICFHSCDWPLER